MFFHASGFSLTGLGTLGLLVYTLPSSSSSHVLSLLAFLSSSSSYSVSDVLSTRVRLYDPSRMVLRLSGSPHTASSSSGCTTLPSGLLSVRARSCLFRSVLIYIYTTVQLSYTLAIQVSPSVRPSQLISPSLCVIPAISSSSLYMLFCYGLVALYCSFFFFFSIIVLRVVSLFSGSYGASVQRRRRYMRLLRCAHSPHTRFCYKHAHAPFHHHTTPRHRLLSVLCVASRQASPHSAPPPTPHCPPMAICICRSRFSAHFQVLFNIGCCALPLVVSCEHVCRLSTRNPTTLSDI